MTLGRTRARPLLAACLALPAIGCAESGVVRSFDGDLVRGRAIAEQAYALYAVGAEREALGDDASALRFFEAAQRYDSGSPELWARVGALQCRRPDGLAAAHAAFASALSISAGDPSLLVSLGRCLLDRGDVAAALDVSTKAVARAPDDEAAALLEIESLKKAGRAPEAWRWASELVLRAPGSRAAWHALEEVAKARGDVALMEATRRRRRELAPAAIATTEGGDGDGAPLGQVDSALLRDEVDAARRHAHRAHITPGEVALRAVGLGRLSTARREAELVLRAAPDDTSARIAEAVSADLAGDTEALRVALARLVEAPGAAPTALGRLLFAELLDRRVDREAALRWLGAAGARSPTSPSDDALLDAIGRRVETALTRETAR